MGPLVPDIIGNDLNFIVAVFIGIAFGFVLEQAGFSTSKKLVGLFYGYDFTVLRVFFTAGIVAMLGVIALNHWGLLDVTLIYINPTYLWSAIVGGLIMGLGFVIGGFCPGTSVCAAAIGKIDAMIFIAGSFLGVLLFAEGYPLLEGFYKADYWGDVTVFDTLGMSQSLFAFLLFIVAVAAFWIITLIEKRVNGVLNPEFSNKKLYVSLTVLAVCMALFIFTLPDRRETVMNEAVKTLNDNSYKINTIDSDELAFRLLDKDDNLQIIDFRPKKDFDKFNLPNSVNIKIENIFEKDAYKLLSTKGKINVFLSYNEYEAKIAIILAKELGYSDVYLLKGGFKQFQTDILNFVKPETIQNRRDSDKYRFRELARAELPLIIKESMQKLTSMETKKSKRVIGGC